MKHFPLLALLLITCSACSSHSSPGAATRPPPGFVPLFNGHDLTGWKGLLIATKEKQLNNPYVRAKLSPTELATEQARADEIMRAHWHVQDGTLVYDGHGENLCTDRDYGNFEMLVDWKITKGGDSGIYLRGTPQVQIWDRPDIGSGGLYNNKHHIHDPLMVADNPPGQWNRFHIKLVGDKVTVWLNGHKVVDNTTLENYWDPTQRLLPTGPIELQNHSSQLWFRNIFIKEIPRTAGR
jgi:hypothetical protein